MAIKVRCYKNTEQEVHLKIVADDNEKDSVITIPLSSFCYKPDSNCVLKGVEGDTTTNGSTWSGDEVKDQFEVAENDDHKKWEVSLLDMSWSGVQNESYVGRLYRGEDGKEPDFDHEIMVFCNGDTCQLELDGLSFSSDREFINNNITFKIHGSMTIWSRWRKRNYKHFAGEYASYGAYEDDDKRGPKE